MIKSQLLR